MESKSMTAWQMFLLVFSYTLGTAIFLRPGELIFTTKQDAWLVPLWCGLLGTVLATFWLLLARKFHGQSIVQICVTVLGKKAGTLFGLLYAWYFIHLSSWVVRNLGDFMSATIMPRTPITAFHLLFLLVCTYAVIQGIRTIGRVSEFLTPLIFLTFSLVWITRGGDWNFERFLPVFELDLWKSIVENRQMLAFPFMETSAFLMIFPLVHDGKYVKPFLKGIVLSALTLSLVTFLTIGILGVVRASHLTYPLFTIAKEIDFGNFVQHVEATTTMFWIFAIFVKLTVSLYCATLALCQLFHIQKRGIVAFPLIWLIAGIALSDHANVVEMMDWDHKYDFAYQLLYTLFIPLLLISVSWMRRNHVDHGSEESV